MTEPFNRLVNAVLIASREILDGANQVGRERAESQAPAVPAVLADGTISDLPHAALLYQFGEAHGHMEIRHRLVESDPARSYFVSSIRESRGAAPSGRRSA